MEINFGISGLLRPSSQQGKDKDKNSKSSKKKMAGASSGNTLPLPRRWSFKLPKLVERKGETEVKSGKRPGKSVGLQTQARTGGEMKQRAWVSKILLNEREHYQSGRRAVTQPRKYQEEEAEREEGREEEEEEELDGERDSGSLSSISGGDLINLRIKEMYSSPLLDVTMPEIFTQEKSQPFLQQEFYENSENSGSNATEESFVDEASHETCSFEDIDNIMDTITENVSEMDLYDNIVDKDDEMEEDYAKDDCSKTSSEDIVITFNAQPKLKGKGSILKHPGQKRRHIKHVEFLDIISDDQGNSDSVRYF